MLSELRNTGTATRRESPVSFITVSMSFIAIVLGWVLVQPWLHAVAHGIGENKCR